MQMSRKKIKKSLFASPCDWLVGYYFFTIKDSKYEPNQPTG